MSATPMETPDDAPVLFDERATRDGRRIGIATLNAPKTLNGLSLPMARLLDERLRAWADDDGIVMVLLQGAGEKAFCAGGDLHGLYRGMLDHRDGSHDIARDTPAAAFFATEYRLDYHIHRYAKPVLCWGHGIVMGGGIGLMAGASHRVVTERSKLAFPEITVGLYPDVGGSWLLRRVPGHGGIFLALTGAPLNAGDAIHARLADHFVESSRHDEVVARLIDTAWSDAATKNHATLSALLESFAQPASAGPLQQHAALIERLCAPSNLDEVVAGIIALDTDDAWLQAAKTTLLAGAPGSARLGFELQRRAADLSLADTFRLEYAVSLHCAAHGDFAEGIRALLIDKDRQPRWNPATLAEATPAWAETFFHAPWAAADHPLADLGASTESSP
ncbi:MULTISPECIES: enoyl-CoA hydratase/isomerase family protein [unclassified Luteibacter]|uniref:enoyl-CoA hydratase/isomerase family protein n=1 Tax=Luteibacter sp. PvP019 TaxID=3156436 RepID=UPI0033957A6F